MSEQIVKQNGADVAITAANLTVDILDEAIAAKGEATWVMAGGTAPMTT